MGLADGLAVGIGIPGMFISIFFCGDACGFGDADGICIPGIFISIFCCGDADGDGFVCGMFIPGMFICWGEGLAVGDDCVAGIFIPGIFIPGMFPIWFLFGELFAGALFLRDAVLRRCIGIFIPGMFIPGMLLISCFLVGRLFRVTLFFLGAAFLLVIDFDFGIFIPGMFCMS